MSPGGSSCSRKTARGLCVLVALIVGSLAVTAVDAAGPRRTLVLTGGDTVEVADAKIRGNVVLVTRLDGRRVPVDVGRVDLAASGLDRAPAAGRLALGGALVDPDSLGSATGTAPVITDADVGHVGRDRATRVPGAGRPPASGPPGIKVSGVDHVISGSRATVTGTVSNTTAGPVEGLVIEATALAADKTQLGHAATSLGTALQPGASRRFSIPLTVTATPAAVRVFVNAPVNRVMFDVD